MTRPPSARILSRTDSARSRLPHFVGAALAAVLVALLLVVTTGAAQRWDDMLSLLIHRSATPALTRAMTVVTFLGTHSGTAPLIVTVLFLLVSRRRYDLALGFALLTVGGEGPVEWIKMLIQRPRPDLWSHPYVASGYSFPSGHATYGVILPSALVILVWQHVRRRGARIALVTAATALGGAIGFSRLVLGVHYPTDILAGFVLGGLWVCLYVGPFRAVWRAECSAAQVLAIALALAMVVASRWINSPGFGPTIPEAALDLICLALIAWGIGLRIAAHCLPRDTSSRAADRTISQATCAGTLLLGCGLALMLHDAMVLGIFILFFCLWWAVASCEAEGEVVTPDAAPIPWQAALRACWGRGGLAMAARKEASVLALTLFAAGMIERREWIALGHPLALRATADIAAVLVALLVWTSLRGGALRIERRTLRHSV